MAQVISQRALETNEAVALQEHHAHQQVFRDGMAEQRIRKLSAEVGVTCKKGKILPSIYFWNS